MKRGSADFWWSLFALFLVIFFVVIFSILFIPAIIEALLNGAILYFIFLKTYSDIKKRKRHKLYLFSAIFSGIFLLLRGNILPLWSITSWAVLYMFIVLILLVISTKKKKKR
jgi:membrane protein YdbS with pleckstrin-like domain